MTDANLVLGRFAGSGLLSGAMALDESRAASAVDELAQAMSAASARKVTRIQAALGVIQVANSNMERALRLVSVERGHDPRRFALLSFGGAGGLHAAALAAALRTPRVLIPAVPGAFSALGVLLADVVKDYSRTIMTAVGRGRKIPREVDEQFAALIAQATDDLREEGFSIARMKMMKSLALRYRGQSFELEISAGRDAIERFHQAHRERYGHADPGRVVEIVSLRVRGIGITEKPQLKEISHVRRAKATPIRTARVWFAERASQIDVYERSRLKPGSIMKGPAIITEYGSTTLLPAGWTAVVDGWENLVLDC